MLGYDIGHILVCMHVGGVNHHPGREILTVAIPNVKTLHASLYDSSCDTAKYTLIFRIHQEWRYIMAVDILVELEHLVRITRVF